MYGSHHCGPLPSCVVQVAIVDDEQISRWGLERLLGGQPRIEVVASVGSAEHLQSLGVEPDVVFCELYLGGVRPAFEVVTRLATHARVVAMSSRQNRNDAVAVLRAGGHGLVSKRAPVEDFVNGVETVARGGIYLPDQNVGELYPPYGHLTGDGGASGLTPRESEALGNIANGLTHSQAAGRMGVTVSTFNTYICRVREKLGVGNKAELTRRAIELGLAS